LNPSKACDSKDHVTQDLAIKLQADEEAHRCLFEGFLKSLRKESASVAGGLEAIPTQISLSPSKGSAQVI